MRFSDPPLFHPVPYIDRGVGLAFMSFSFSAPSIPEGAIQQYREAEGAFYVELFSSPEAGLIRQQLRNHEKFDFRPFFRALLRDISSDVSFDELQTVSGPDKILRDRFSREWFFPVRWFSGNDIRKRLDFPARNFYVTVAQDLNGVFHDGSIPSTSQPSRRR